MQVARSQKNKGLYSQALTAFGATRIDNGASSTCFHAHQEAMGASASCFRGLVCAFHLNSLNASRKPCIILQLLGLYQVFFAQEVRKHGFVDLFICACG
jgi:hypothetical protein